MTTASPASSAGSSPAPRRRSAAVRLPWRRGSAGLCRGTEQAAVVAALDGCVDDLRALRTSGTLPDALTGPAVEVLVAAGGARDVAVRVARAVDALDAALDRAHALGPGVPATPAAAAALARMYDRRQRLVAALHDGLGQVQDLHSQLLELAAAAELSRAAADDVQGVRERLALVRRAFAEVAAAATSPPPSR
jgi:hypothetical protein